MSYSNEQTFYRTDTILDDDDEAIIKPNKQIFIATLARRGHGKSFLDETCFIGLVERGYTGLDLWSADNLENAFWCVKCDCIKKRDDKLKEIENRILKETDPDKRLEIVKEFEKEKRKLYCKAHKRYPITILAPDSLVLDKIEVDLFNGYYYTKDEWIREQQKAGNLIIEYNKNNPSQKPKEKHKEWIKFVRIPMPTRKEDSEQNKQIVEIVKQAILECRSKRRILVFNPMMFPIEFQGFKTLEIIIRSLRDIKYEHFNQIDPKEVGKKSWDELTDVEKNWDKIVVLFREFGELAPAKLKGDKSGDSTLVKKALLQFMRKVRHYQISVVTDWQKNSDVENAIRSQVDVTFIKKWSRRLADDEWKWAFEFIKDKRLEILMKGRFSARAFMKANSLYPKIEKLAKNYMYHVTDDDRLELMDVPVLNYHHKEPNESWSRYTGIKIAHDMTIVTKEMQNAMPKKSSATDEKVVYSVIFGMKHGEFGSMETEDIIIKLTEMQEKGEITWHKIFKDMKPNTFNKMYSRMKSKYGDLIIKKTGKKGFK